MNRFMWVFGLVVVVAVVLYYGFLALDSMGLPTNEGQAVVTGMEYQPPGTTYRREVIGGTARSIPHTTGEMYIVELDVDGGETATVVDREQYESLSEGDVVRVQYQRRRLTGTLQVMEVTIPTN